MIFIVMRATQSEQLRRFLAINRSSLRGVVKILAYENLFRWRCAPVGHYVFTDFDRLRTSERHAAECVARALVAAVPRVRILNRPAVVLERYALLRALAVAGINSFDAIRLDEGRRPGTFPVFLRHEDEYHGAETDLIESPAAYDAAIAELQARGTPLRGMLAVGYRAAAGADGQFRKYGVMRIGDRLVPIHLLSAPHWMVKRSGSEITQSNIDEELAFVRDNPHREVLDRAFSMARIEYGRADYGVVDGRVEIYEINTNPVVPTGRLDARRSERSRFVVTSMIEAFHLLDDQLPAGEVPFDPPEPLVFPFTREDAFPIRAARRLRRAIARQRLRSSLRLA